MGLRINPHTGEEVWVEPGAFTPWHTFVSLEEKPVRKEGATRVTPKELWKVVDNYGVDICTGFVNSTHACNWANMYHTVGGWRLETYYEDEEPEGTWSEPKTWEEAPVLQATDFPSAFDYQEAGSHYSGLKIQPGDYIHENGLTWYAANVVKYVSRADKKGGAGDWKKVIHYARMELEKVYGIRTRVEYSE